MRTHRLRLLHRGQKGITLIEMLVAVTLVGLLAGGIAATISQVWAISFGASDHMVAVRQVQQAGDRISKDVQQARAVELSGTDFLTVSWQDYETKDLHTVVYTLEDMPDGLKKLQRSLEVTPDEDEPTTTTTVSIVAQYIDANGTNFDVRDDGVYVLKVTATVGRYSVERDYEIERRPG